MAENQSLLMQSISTMSSPTSTPYLTPTVTSSNLGKISNFSINLQHQPKRLRPMVTGSSLGTASSTLPSLSSNTEDKSCNPMANTSKDISRLSPHSFTTESLTMIEPSESEQLNDEMSSSLILPSSQICRSSGLVTHRQSPIVNLRNPESLR